MQSTNDKTPTIFLSPSPNSPRRGSFMSNLFSSATSRPGSDHKDNNYTSSTNSNDNLSTLTSPSSINASYNAFNTHLNTSVSKIGASAMPAMLCGLLQKDLLTQQQSNQFSLFQNLYTGHVSSYHYSNIEQHRISA